jgi:hypothetical protein
MPRKEPPNGILTSPFMLKIFGKTAHRQSRNSKFLPLSALANSRFISGKE